MILRDNGLSDNAVHETFIKAINHIEKLNDENCPKTRSYLVTICENVAKDIYNAQKRMSLTGEEVVNEKYSTGDDEQNPLNAAIAKESRSRIMQAIYDLPTIYRDVILLKHTHKHSNAEICELLNILPETFNKRQNRARHLLKQALAKEGLR